MNPLPPQAYTQDTLLKAFNWLQNQPPHIKETAITTDILVSLYLKAQMQGEEALNRPSIHNFRKDLKSLAGMMVEFEGEKPIPTPTVSTPNVKAAAPKTMEMQTPHLDEKSKLMIQEVMTQFNLSSEQEALRLLIATGFQQLKPLIKTSKT